MFPIENRALWKRLVEFEFDSGAPSFGFADRLARENGWTKAEAENAIVEYKRFVCLAMTSGSSVSTPIRSPAPNPRPISRHSRPSARTTPPGRRPRPWDVDITWSPGR